MAIEGNTSIAVQHTRIRLNHNILTSINAVQGDTGREFYFVFDDFKVPEDTELRVYVQKPSGREIYHYCYLANGEVVVQPTMQMLAEVGQNYGQIQIIKSGVTVTSFPFRLEVEKNLVYSISITSMDEYLILDSLIDTCRIKINEIQTLNATLTRQENERVEAEGNRNNAETERENAESLREQAEAKREQDVADTIKSCNDSIDAAIQSANKATADTKDATTKCTEATDKTVKATNDCNTAINNCETATDSANKAAELCQSVIDKTGIVLKTEKGVADGVSTLDENAKIPVVQMPYQIHYGTESPDNSLGNNGDIYFMIIE